MTLDPIRPYLPLVYGGIAALTIGALVWQNWRIDSLKEQRASLQSQVDGYIDAQRTNLSTIDDLQTANVALADACKLDAENAAAALASVLAAHTATEKKLIAAQGELKNVYARNPQARAWGRTAVPRAVADRLPQ